MEAKALPTVNPAAIASPTSWAREDIEVGSTMVRMIAPSSPEECPRAAWNDGLGGGRFPAEAA